MPRAAAQIVAEIVARLGFLPPFYEAAVNQPVVLESLWQKTVAYYLEGPLPALFKERLAVLLARHCAQPYCLVCHTCTLRPLGMSAQEILQLLHESKYELRQPLDLLRQSPPCAAFPETGSLLEDTLLHAAVHLYDHPQDQEHHLELQRVLGMERYHYLVFFLDFNRTCLEWVAAHPDVQYAADQRAKEHLLPLVREEPSLAIFFGKYDPQFEARLERLKL